MKHTKTFFQCIFYTVLILLHGIAFAQNTFSVSDPNERICSEKFALAQREHWQKRPIGEVVALVGKSFIGIPYAADTLEVPGEEHLVVQLRTMDCVLLYENSLAFARCIKKGTETWAALRKELQLIRYRGGVLNGYSSRLHYTTDYFFDNEQKNILKNITGKLRGIAFPKTVNYMTTHPEKYPSLNASPKVLQQMKYIENEINRRKQVYLPKSQVKQMNSHILEGDIVGITTTVDGLDCSHTGIVVWKNGTPHLLHAPNPGSVVQVTMMPLDEYLTRIKSDTGIIVMRALEP